MFKTDALSILIISSNKQLNDLVVKAINRNDCVINTLEGVTHIVDKAIKIQPDIIILDEYMEDIANQDLAKELISHLPSVKIILLLEQESLDKIKNGIRIGISDFVKIPFKSKEISDSISNIVEKNNQQKNGSIIESKTILEGLEKQVHDLELITQLSKAVTRTLDIDHVLTLIVDAAVKLTDAEEGSILLLDEKTNEVYMRAARNFNEDFIRTFRMPINDSLVGSVISRGEPVILDEDTPTKIKTSYLIHSLIYVPIKTEDRTIGVLGVDNRHKVSTFTNTDIKLLTALAEYAMIAIINAQLYESLLEERNKFESVLKQIQDCVILVDKEMKLLFANHAALDAFGITEDAIIGRPFNDKFLSTELLDILDDPSQSEGGNLELQTEDKRYFHIRKNEIVDIGYIITMNDITYLKNINQIKNDFVNTVSHDLRSPLTAIMGYLELIRRTGSLNNMQNDFINQIQLSVNNITKLVNDLLNLGRIESGLDTSKEYFSINETINQIIDAQKVMINNKRLKLTTNLPDGNPSIYANQRQIRQMADNLLENMIKYTPEGKQLEINGELKENQIILQFRDEGIGIPAKDLPNIFEKFFRASNTDPDVTGTGLGLSIVKSIVDYHSGRIWVDSKPGIGTSFFVLLPLDLV